MTEFLAFQSLTEITEVIVIVTLLSGLFLGSVLYVLMRRGLLRRVEQLYVGSEAIGRGNLDYRIPSLGDDEIGDLGKALNTMARNLEKTTTSRDRLDMEVKEREQALADLAESAAALRRSNAELEQFAYVASHDLQEPLRMVGSYLQLLSRRYRGYIAADADKWIDFAVDGANRMKQLIEDLLAYSRVSSHGVEQVLVDSEQALGEVLRDLAAAVAESGARISHDQLPMVLADPQQLNQLLQNLIGNAIKYRGGPATRDPCQRRIGRARLPFLGARQRHRYRTAFRRAHFPDLPAPARGRQVLGHRHRAGGVQAHRRTPRRAYLGRVAGRSGFDVLLYIAGRSG